MNGGNMNRNGRIKFVAGNGKISKQRSFAQEFFYNNDFLPEEFEEEKVEREFPEEYEGCCPEPECDEGIEEELTTIDCDKMFFCGGAEGREEFFSVRNERLNSLQNEQRQVRPQTSAEIARDVYNKMLVLGQLYRDLENFGNSFADELRDMIEELNVITFAMGRIYLSLSRGNRLPIQNQRKPQIRDFCGGLVTTSNYLRGLLFDLRRLQRAVENQNIDTQLIIINITLMSHQQQLQQMRQDCR